MIKSAEISDIALKYFNSNEFEKAALEFEKASLLNPMDYSNYENAAIANYMIGNYDKPLIKSIRQLTI